MKLFDRIKFLGKKAADKTFKVTSIEELEYCIKGKEEKLSEINTSLYELRSKRKYYNNQLEELQKSINDIKHVCKTKYADREKHADRLKEAFELIQQSNSKLNLLQGQVKNHDVLIKSIEDGRNVLNKEVSALRNQLEELKIKQSFTDTFKSYTDLNIGTDDVQIEKLIQDIEVGFDVTESKIQEKASKTSMEDFIKESKEENEFEDFLNSL